MKIEAVNDILDVGAQLNFSRYCRHSVSDLDEFRHKLCARAALLELLRVA